MKSMKSSIGPQIYGQCKHQTSISYNPTIKCRGFTFKTNPSLHSLSTSKSARYTKADVKAYASLGPPGPPFASLPSPDSWKFWAIGALISAILPLLGNKFGPLLKLKNEVEAVVETADRIVEVVEKVAEEVEKVAGEVADHMPEGGKLKDALILIENVAKETAKDAHMVDQVLDKVEQVEKEVDSFIDQASGNKQA